MDLLIGRADFTGFRTITQNIDDVKRLDPFILEAQELDFAKMVTDSFYQDIVTIYKSYKDKVAYNSTDPAPDPLQVITAQELAFALLLEGEGQFYKGIKPVLVYLSFARFVRSDNMRSTPSGFVQKNTDFSTPISSKQISEMAQRAENDAEAFMNKARKWMKDSLYFKTYDYNTGCCDTSLSCGRSARTLGAPRNKYSFRKRIR